MRLVGYILLVLIGAAIGSYWPLTPYLPPKDTALETVRDNVPFLADWLPEADEAEAVEESTEVLEESAETGSEAVEETIELAEEIAEYVVVGASTEAAEEAAAQDVEAADLTVHIFHNHFEPDYLSIIVGDTVRFHNMQEMPEGGHTLVTDDSSIESPELDVDQTWEHTFEAAATYKFHVVGHEWAKADVTIVVQSASAAPQD